MKTIKFFSEIVMTEKSALFLLEGSKPNELPLSGVVTLFSLQLTILLIALISNAFTSTFIVRHHDRLQIFRRLTLLQCTLCYCVNFVRILLILRLIALPNIGWDWPKNMYFFLTYRLLNILFTTMLFVCEDMVTAMRYLVTFHEDWMDNNESAWHHQTQTCLWHNQRMIWDGNVQPIKEESQKKKNLGSSIFLLEDHKNASVNNQPSPEFVDWIFAFAPSCMKLKSQWLPEAGNLFEQHQKTHMRGSRCNPLVGFLLSWLGRFHPWK